MAVRAAECLTPRFDTRQKVLEEVPWEILAAGRTFANPQPLARLIGVANWGCIPIFRWLNFPPPKTDLSREIPLWPETVQAIRDALAARQKPKNEDNSGLLFIGPQGKGHFRDTTGKDGSLRGARAYGLSHEFAEAGRAASINDRSFYDLRRTFQTVAEGAHDLAAVQSIMGHAARTNDRSAVYRSAWTTRVCSRLQTMSALGLIPIRGIR